MTPVPFCQGSFVFLTVQILSAEQIRAWDQFTIQHEPVSSIDLMERASRKCVEWIRSKDWQGRPFVVCCGKGNNGGDGLAISRQLLKAGVSLSIYILEFGRLGSDDFQLNLQRLHEMAGTKIHFVQSADHFPPLSKETVVIDALFGSGLNKALEGLAADFVAWINRSGATVVSIDLPSGLFIDRSSLRQPVVVADYTLTFQCYKEALLVQENAPFIGEVKVLDIGLLPAYLEKVKDAPSMLDEQLIRKLFRPRKRFSHKGTFGHALLVGGSYGKMGAMVLATKACMAAGAGLTTAFVPRCGNLVLQTTAPEAMALLDEQENHLATLPADIDRFSAIGIGPGMGTEEETQGLLSFLVRRAAKPLVFDADGLNCLAKNKALLAQLPKNALLTPHPKEFDRLFGEHANDFDRVQTAAQKAGELGVVIILKGHHSLIAAPDRQMFFNSTGNAGMAKGGSGDVLTGILTALLAQGYAPLDAAQLGVYLHGWAGDFAARRYSQEAMLPSHLVGCLADVFLALAKKE